ncbi:MAG: hypothetical protein JKX85_16290, partial [Phycisphaeraceae bacterium]|nr:hypothetical protein [Phycisphaeraceae bacterium]
MNAKVKENSKIEPTMPDEHGHFGIYGGRFVAETLMTPLKELEAAYFASKEDATFQQELDADL